MADDLKGLVLDRSYDAETPGSLGKKIRGPAWALRAIFLTCRLQIP